MAMLDLMLRFRDAVSIRIGIFHLNHLTRGLDSDNDALFVKEKADGYVYLFMKTHLILRQTESRAYLLKNRQETSVQND
jgi:hypothetical protein